MKRVLFFSLLVMLQMVAKSQVNVESGHKLPKELREISGIDNDGNDFWAIGDDESKSLFRIGSDGTLKQHILLNNVRMTDIEAVSSDRRFVYIGDIGDNSGVRATREIVKISKKDIDAAKGSPVNSERIIFTFPDEGIVKKKKSNNFDCEAMVVLNDSIYLFSKRRDDMRTAVYVVPSKPGTWVAREAGIFKTKGLVTDAALNASGNELALIGYEDGHRNPFLYIFSGFREKDFFAGSHRRYELSDSKSLDWQVESVSFGERDEVFLACERTKDVPASLFKVKLSELRVSGKD